MVVPKGVFLTATIYLKDNVTLHLQRGTTLLGINKIADYPAQPPTATRIDRFLSRSLVFARGAKNISITGEGTIDGQGRVRQSDFLDDPRRNRQHRPMLIWFDRCEHVTVRDVTLKASGFWTQAYSRSRDVKVSRVTVNDSVNDNNDGCDIVDSRDFIVEGCNIDCIDDGICLKAFTEAGCRNIAIRNNRVKSLCNAIKTGTDSSGNGFQNVLIENNELYQVGRAGIAIETTDGGIVRNIVVTNTKMNVVGTPIFIKLGDRQRPTLDEKGKEIAPKRIGIVEDIRISGVRATVDAVTMPHKEVLSGDERRLYRALEPKTSSISGIPGHYIKGVRIDDVRIEVLGGYKKPITGKYVDHDVPEKSAAYPNPDMMGILPAYGFFVRHVNGLRMQNIEITSRVADPRAMICADDVHDSKLLRISTKNSSASPVFRIRPTCTNVVAEETR